MQLDLLLRSKAKYCGDLFSEVFVLYTASSVNFELGYGKLMDSWPTVRFVEETDFRGNVFTILGQAQDVVCVMADDCIFYQPVNIGDQILTTIKRADVASFSLGIGLNCHYSGTIGYSFEQPLFQKSGDVLIWNWKTADDGEFCCPFMLAGNFYKKSDYVNRLSAIEFNCPSWYENQLQRHWQVKHGKPEDVATMPDLMSCGVKQYLVHSMNNVVQDVFGNPHGDEYYYSPSELNLRYLGDQTVDLDAMNFEDINGLHKEIKFFFKKEDRK